MRSFLIDGEAVECDDNGIAVFELLLRKPTGDHVFMYAFDLLELMARTFGASRSKRAKRRWPGSYGAAPRVSASMTISPIPARSYSVMPAS